MKEGILLFFACIFILPIFGDIDELKKLKNEIKKMQKRIKKLEDEGKQKKQDKEEQASKKEEQVSKKENLFEVFWKNGPLFETKDKSFTFKIGGRIMLDFAFAEENNQIKQQIGRVDNQAEFRRARLYMVGTIYKSIIFKMQYDFSGQTSFRDVFIGVKDLPFGGTLYIGHFQEPFSLELLTSTKYITFIERTSLATFSPSHNIGIAYCGNILKKRITFAMGIFKDTEATPPIRIDFGTASYNFTTRFTGLPVYNEKGKQLLHLGVGYSYRNPDNPRYRQRPEIHFPERFVDTGNLGPVEDEHRAVAEAAMVLGPFSLQSEIAGLWYRPRGGSGGSREVFWSYYAYASFFLTGEHRRYSMKKAAFSRIKIKKPLFGSKEKGIGAIELALRYSILNLNDDTRGGRMDNITAGINWYSTNHTRVMLNYVYSYVSSHPRNIGTGAFNGHAHMVVMRFQIDF